MDTGGLDRRGIDGVDIGHDDRTTIKIWFAFSFMQFILLQTSLPSYCAFTTPTLAYAFKFPKSIFIVLNEEIFRIDMIFTAVLIHPPS